MISDGWMDAGIGRHRKEQTDLGKGISSAYFSLGRSFITFLLT